MSRTGTDGVTSILQAEDNPAAAPPGPASENPEWWSKFGDAYEAEQAAAAEAATPTLNVHNLPQAAAVLEDQLGAPLFFRARSALGSF